MSSMLNRAEQYKWIKTKNNNNNTRTNKYAHKKERMKQRRKKETNKQQIKPEWALDEGWFMLRVAKIRCVRLGQAELFYRIRPNGKKLHEIKLWGMSELTRDWAVQFQTLNSLLYSSLLSSACVRGSLSPDSYHPWFKSLPRGISNNCWYWAHWSSGHSENHTLGNRQKYK